jgi:methionyl-tRNA formyltransferase
VSRKRAQRLRVLLIGEGPAGVEALRMISARAHELVAVVTRSAGETYGASLGGVASRLGYQVWPPDPIRQAAFADVVRRERVDLLLNMQGPHLLPAEVVAAPPMGSFNCHLGPLPRYAGLNAPSWAIYHGERMHAVTFHWMDQNINTGPLAYSVEFPIEPDDTGLTLSGKCLRAALPLLHDLLSALGTGDVPRRPQPQGVRRYYGREVPHEGRLLWSEPAARVVSFIRACDYAPFPSPWRSPRAYLGGREISVLKAVVTGQRSEEEPGTIGGRVSSGVLVAARDQWVEVQRVLVGTSSFPAAEALRPGERFAVPSPTAIPARP